MSDWQLDRMRLGLRILAAHADKLAYTVDDSRTGNSDRRASDDMYVNLAEAIEAKTDVSITPGPLAKFMIGVPDKTKPGGRHFSKMEPDSLEAIREFLTDSDDPKSPLKAVDLIDFAPDLQAPYHLLEYLQQHIHQRAAVRPKQLVGTYFAEKYNATPATAYDLTIERPVEDGLLQVFLHREEFYLTEQDKEESTSLSKLLRTADKTFRYKGWAVITPEDSIIMFLKPEDGESNTLLFTIACNADVLDGHPLMGFVALNHHYPAELEGAELDQDDPEIISNILSNLSNNLLIFRRKRILLDRRIKTR